MFSHLYPESYTPFSSPHFPPIKHYQDILFKLLTLSTDSVTVYFYNSDPIFATKNFVTRVCTQSKKLYEDILALLDLEKMWAGKGV